MSEKRKEEQIKSFGQNDPNNRINFDLTGEIKRISQSANNEGRIESFEERKYNENSIEYNFNTNQSNNRFLSPISQIPSSSHSTNKEGEYMTPKSRHNLNLLFTQSNGKKSQNQSLMINSVNANSPLERGFINYSYNLPISPIDPTKFNSDKQSNMILSVSSNKNSNSNNIHFAPNGEFYPNFISNNKEAISTNKHNDTEAGNIFNMRNNSKKIFRKIQFSNDNMDSKYKSSSIIKHENDHLESDNIPVAELSSTEVNNENEIKKPQPIVANTVRIHLLNSDSRDQIFIPQFQPYSNFRNNCRLNTTMKLTPREFQHKRQQELEKKKFFCNCKRSKCLKLYCECFANGEYCINCNCLDCFNIIGNEVEKDEAFQLIKDKNPVAMKLNNIKESNKEETIIGCNCTKSNCSKKYCECYKSNLKCTESCRCLDCTNSSENKVKEFKTKTTISNNREYAYNYDDFTVEKISIQIKDKKINVQKLIIDYDNQFSNYFLKGNKNYDNKEKANSAIFKNINNSFFIVINKSYINYPFSQIPTNKKLKKRKRNESTDYREKYDCNDQLLSGNFCGLNN